MRKCFIGVEVWSSYNERGENNFIAGRKNPLLQKSTQPEVEQDGFSGKRSRKNRAEKNMTIPLYQALAI